MKLEQQVCSLKLARKLKELGLKQESLIFWRFVMDDLGGDWFVSDLPPREEQEPCSAYSVAELGEMLPTAHYTFKNQWDEWTPVDADEKVPCAVEKDGTEADARAKMLIYLIEKGLYDPKE